MQNNNRYIFLDGIRGFAALVVLTRHTTELWSVDFFRNYLAVDLFFILSGFVIGHAYEAKLVRNSLTARDFIITRLIRLYPIYFSSLLICLILTITNIAPTIKTSSTETTALTFSLSALMLPSKISTSPSLFPVNGPYWSLFFELIDNFLYVYLRPLLTNRIIFTLVILFGFLVSSVALLRGDLDVGHTWSIGSIAAGFSRSSFGFLTGILIFRNKERLSLIFKEFHFPWLATIFIIAILLLPSSEKLNPYIDIASVILLFPILITIAAQGRITKGEKLLSSLGSASYPVYVLHLPLGLFFIDISNKHPLFTPPASGFIFLVLIFSLSLTLEKIFDLPTRRWLTRVLIKKPEPSCVTTEQRKIRS